MKTVKSTLLTIVFCLLLILSCEEKSQVKDQPDLIQNETGFQKYDSAKAAAYGADQYGMKKYVMAFLKRGPNKSIDSVKKAALQKAHLQNIDRLASEGKLVLAGPFFGEGELRGIYIFNVDNLEEAEALTNSDPSIQAGVLSMDLKEWYGSAALMAVNDIHHSVSKKDITETE